MLIEDQYLLNTVLFALGGVVWGKVISTNDSSRNEQFDGKDWGYLFLVYLLISLIRLFLFVVYYPMNNMIGLESDLKEMLFQSFGGLRGAVGIGKTCI